MTTRSPWTRIDSHALELTLGLALLLVGLFQALFPLLGVTGPFPPIDTRDVRIDRTAEVPPLRSGGTTLQGTNDAELAVADPALWDRVLLATPQIVHAALIIVILSILMRMAATFRTGDVFVPANIRRLYAIAVTLLVTATAVPALDMITTEALISGTPLTGTVTSSYTLQTSTVILSILVAALAGAFGHGTRLRADTEGLV
ncbi:DUF2975 domain-containing protein [Actinomadura madurae]|uniref:DUF2975 domain-containing protein n=1 Tax=Actinomadura madurae TaxID=1993 RepID=UPI0020D238E6|nr:DUF2975 domain-containing protein [Actinomadura madurae]MCP9950343.1 DUF2975 domain-containing protein [Actinomadura madurae]MCP9967123.1 DUF2975 domain-containing protein [Actinomadura madurae]MCQ0008881.1 DUF2975 domain-containing protein [Actinomadura madurae]MCQ0015800.1 DUF2975 domain-containing protein [Actinomadura madurae]